MSYLIALYVYYHGNNLALFGINKGATDEELNNKGLKRPEEINPDFVDSELINAALEEEEKERQTETTMNWDHMMKDAINKAQKSTYDLHQGGFVEGSIFDQTSNAVVDSYDEDGSIPMDFFSSINGF